MSARNGRMGALGGGVGRTVLAPAQARVNETARAARGTMPAATRAFGQENRAAEAGGSVTIARGLRGVEIGEMSSELTRSSNAAVTAENVQARTDSTIKFIENAPTRVPEPHASDERPTTSARQGSRVSSRLVLDEQEWVIDVRAAPKNRRGRNSRGGVKQRAKNARAEARALQAATVAAAIEAAAFAAARLRNSAPPPWVGCRVARRVRGRRIQSTEGSKAGRAQSLNRLLNRSIKSGESHEVDDDDTTSMMEFGDNDTADVEVEQEHMSPTELFDQTAKEHIALRLPLVVEERLLA